MLAPTAPHLAEELWAARGCEYSIHNQPFPTWDESLAADEEVTLVVQVNGKVRDRVTVSAAITEDEAKEVALSSERIRAFVKNGPRKVIYVPRPASSTSSPSPLTANPSLPHSGPRAGIPSLGVVSLISLPCSPHVLPPRPDRQHIP